MGSSPIVFSRERNFRELITDTVSFVFQELIPFFKYLALFTGPVLVLSLILPYFFVEEHMTGFISINNTNNPWIMYVFYLLNISCLTIYTNSYIDVYRKGDDINAASIWNSVMWHYNRLISILMIAAVFAGIMIFLHTYKFEEQQLNTFIWISLITLSIFIYLTIKYSLIAPLLSSTSSSFSEVIRINSQLIKGRIFIAISGYILMGFATSVLTSSVSYIHRMLMSPIGIIRGESKFTDIIYHIMFNLPQLSFILIVTVLLNVFNYLHFTNLEGSLVYEKDERIPEEGVVSND